MLRTFFLHLDGAGMAELNSGNKHENSRCAALLHLFFVSQAVGRTPNVECRSEHSVSNEISIYTKILLRW